MALTARKITIWIGAAFFSTLAAAAPNSSLYSTFFSILSYAKWPAAAPEICVINNPGLAQQLKNHKPAADNYSISSIQSHEIRGADCVILLFSTLSEQEEQQLLNTAVSYPALSISINNPHCETGSAFCLYKKNQSFAFKVNMESLTQSKIHIDPRVLLLAKTAEAD